jgi:hypothetical protein
MLKQRASILARTFTHGLYSLGGLPLHGDAIGELSLLSVAQAHIAAK